MNDFSILVLLQAEESEIEAKLKELQCEIDAANITLSRLYSSPFLHFVWIY